MGEWLTDSSYSLGQQGHPFHLTFDKIGNEKKREIYQKMSITLKFWGVLVKGLNSYLILKFVKMKSLLTIKEEGKLITKR